MEKQLKALFKLQKIDSQIDQIRKMRGELPMEVADLEDEISGLETRLSKFMDEKNNLRNNVIEFKNRIKESEGLILRYNDQLTNIKNNREYEALSKEIEIQELEVQLCNKRINDNEDLIATKDSEIVEIETVLVSRRADLEIKQAELGDIVAETEKEENFLKAKSEEYQGKIFWFNGTDWKQTQEKTAVNQAPLFDLFDEEDINLNNSVKYQGSTFTGNKIFSYKLK